MMGKLDRKVAVVTASTEGIGLAIAEKLAKDGAKVVISSRQQSNVDKAVDQLKGQGLNVVGTVCDVTNKQHRMRLFEKAVQEYGGIDILVSNAGVSVVGPVFQTTESEYDMIMDTNLKSTFFLCKEAFPYLKKQGGGAIVLVSSIAAYISYPIIGIYATSKAGLLGLAKAMTRELAEYNIRINCISPGIIETKMSIPDRATEAQRQQSLAPYPMKRFGQPEECAGAVSFLVSDEASYITGDNIIIAGGFNARL